MDSAGVFGTSNAHLVNSMLEMPRTLPVSPPAQKHDVTSELLAQFKGLIAQGIVRPGMKLPPERELAGSFNVSRSSLRHALKVLDSIGVIRQRVGDGTYLTTSAASILSQPLEFLILLDGISLSDLMETRLIVEPELAARAAERATSEDLVSLRRSIAGMKGERDEEKLVDLDLAFHDGILRASGNVLMLSPLQPHSQGDGQEHPAYIAAGGLGPYDGIPPSDLRSHRPAQPGGRAPGHDRAPARRQGFAGTRRWNADSAYGTRRQHPAGSETAAENAQPLTHPRQFETSGALHSTIA